MRDESYQLKSLPSLMSFEFESIGPKGKITKLVSYTDFGRVGFYNLGFGDKLGETDDFDDLAITGNNDTLRVLATVAETIYKFTDKYPNAFNVATGSTDARTRLYRMVISNNLEEITQDFKVSGFMDGIWEKFEKNRNYSAFLIIRK